MTQFRRQVLDSVQAVENTNVSLWLDKYLESDDVEAKGNLVKRASQIKITKAYESFYSKWKDALNSLGVELKEAKTLGRLAVNLGAEATLENSIALNRTYGTPLIPGSALKGLAAHYAVNSLKDWNKNQQAYKDIFGTQDIAGYINFYDALYVPDGKSGLVPDVMTVHHQEYYQKDGVPPADWDSPVPIHFLSVSGSFLVALSGSSGKLVQAAFKILALALAHEGIGAKTSSGYGRMEIEGIDISDNGTEKSAAVDAPLAPPKSATWKKGKISSDGKSVQSADSLTQKLYFHREHVLPKDFTPGRKSEVEYLEETMPNGKTRVWVKRMHYPID